MVSPRTPLFKGISISQVTELKYNTYAEFVKNIDNECLTELRGPESTLWAPYKVVIRVP